MTSKFAAALAPIREKAPEPQPEPTESAANIKRGPGRPFIGGKRSSDDYVQTTAYIERKVHGRAMIELAKLKYAEGESGPKDYSELVNTLISKWLSTRNI
jgi:hypothetical protein